MPVLKLDVGSETYTRLVEQAVSERRPVVWQAEIALRRARAAIPPAPGSSVEGRRAGRSRDMFGRIVRPAMRAAPEADYEALARALAALLAAWWRRHAEQEEAPSYQEGASDRDPQAANSRRADL